MRFDGRELEFFTEQKTAGRGEERQQGRGLGKLTSEAIRDRDVARTDGLDQAGHPLDRIRLEFQRVALIIGNVSPKNVDRHQAAERLEVQHTAANRQISSLDKGIAKVPRQERVFEIPITLLPWGQDRDPRVSRCPRRQRLEHLSQAHEKRGDAVHVAAVDQVGIGTAGDDPIFDQITEPRGGPGAIPDHPPMAVGGPRQIGRDDMQPGSTDPRQAVVGPQKLRIP